MVYHWFNIDRFTAAQSGAFNQAVFCGRGAAGLWGKSVCGAVFGRGVGGGRRASGGGFVGLNVVPPLYMPKNVND